MLPVSRTMDMSVFKNATATIDRVSSADYARLYNRIDDDNNNPHRYSDEDIRLFENGSDPYGHPNTDWNDAAYKTGVLHKHNVSINGGTENARYMLLSVIWDRRVSFRIQNAASLTDV